MDGTLKAAVHELAIRNLYARYCYAIDADDGDALAACFTKDGVFTATGGDTLQGREAVRRFVTETVGTRGWHYYVNIEITTSMDSTGTGRARFLLVDKTTGAITALGQTADVFALENDGQWRLTERVATFEWTSTSYRGAFRR